MHAWSQFTSVTYVLYTRHLYITDCGMVSTVKFCQPYVRFHYACLLFILTITGAASSSDTSGTGGVVYTGVYVCLVIPGLVVGTVGGGTQLATQKECLSMMGCFGKVTYNCKGITMSLFCS